MLVAAKWREFCLENPNLQGAEEEKAEKIPTPAQDDEYVDDDENYEDEDAKSKKRRSGRKGGRGSSGKGKTKVPTLKIKIGKRKRGSSVS